MSDLHNLDEAIADDFGFVLNGHEYRMRYPTTEEVVKAQDLKENSKEQLGWLYQFVTPVKPDSPAIKDALNGVNVKKLRKFTEMITEEFGDGKE